MSAPSDGRYTLGSWSGLPNYTCTLCPYATLSGPEAIDEHWQTSHVGAEPPAPPTPVAAAATPR